MAKAPQWAPSGGRVDLFLAVLLKPFVALAVFVPVGLLADWIYRKLPNGRLKKILFSPLPGHRQRDRWPT